MIELASEEESVAVAQIPPPPPPARGGGEFDTSSAWRMHAKKRLWSATKFAQPEGEGSSRGVMVVEQAKVVEKMEEEDIEGEGVEEEAIVGEAEERAGEGKREVGRESCLSGADQGASDGRGANVEQAGVERERVASETVGGSSDPTPPPPVPHETATASAPRSAPARMSEEERAWAARSLAEEGRALHEQQKKQKRDAEGVGLVSTL